MALRELLWMVPEWEKVPPKSGPRSLEPEREMEPSGWGEARQSTEKPAQRMCFHEAR